MKKKFSFVRNLATILVIGPLLTIGCAKTLCIKTVDATTGRPLPGVLTKWTADNQDLVLGSYHYGPTNLPPSTESGVVKIRKVKGRCVSRFIFSHAGYGNVYGIYSSGILNLGTATNSLSDDHFILNGNFVSVGASNGCLLVEMTPVSH
jgi:hypothetical protein